MRLSRRIVWLRSVSSAVRSIGVQTIHGHSIPTLLLAISLPQDKQTVKQPQVLGLTAPALPAQALLGAKADRVLG